MPYYRGSPYGGPCSYVHRSATEICGGLGDRFSKGKSAIAIARQFSGRMKNFTGEHFWARGYAVSTVGFELEEVKKYIQNQELTDRSGQF